jgi:hypothetical protein
MVETIQQIKKHSPKQKPAIHIHGWMEHNLAGYAKYYSCGNIEISRGNEFTRKIDDHRRNFPRYWLANARKSYILNLGQLLKIALELKMYL